ncbi:copper resistance protein CopC [Sphingorhabdus sp. YGSMI21]|uniref:copper resistance protein CopC n=1 Tax=Sphingorhabdus sp. YGSMI21 TaxID=2077182 RepID=UPI001F0B7DE2|nr:copper resistance protein CopC [Sphingorhabdus sp. YGSMI21]
MFSITRLHALRENHDGIYISHDCRFTGNIRLGRFRETNFLLFWKDKLMTFSNVLKAGAYALAVATASVPAISMAHTKVVASNPAQGASVSKPKNVTMTFSEALLPPTVAASIVMTAMPGMKNHQPMVIRNFTAAWSNGNKTLTLNLRKPLQAGTYEVRWQAAGADGHRMKGTVNFTVR